MTEKERYSRNLKARRGEWNNHTDDGEGVVVMRATQKRILSKL
jgi:hypothetical protein